VGSERTSEPNILKSAVTKKNGEREQSFKQELKGSSPTVRESQMKEGISRPSESAYLPLEGGGGGVKEEGLLSIIKIHGGLKK